MASIPKVLILPRKFRIRILQLPDKALQDALGDLENAVCPHCNESIDRTPTFGVDGFWWSHNRTIYLNESLSHTRKMDTLRHELGHAVHDWIAEKFND